MTGDKPPAILDAIAVVVLSYRPKSKIKKPRKRKKRKAKGTLIVHSKQLNNHGLRSVELTITLDSTSTRVLSVPGMTITEKRERLQRYIDAETAILAGQQSYTIQHSGSMWVVTRATLATLREEINRLESEIAAIDGGGIRMRQGVPL